MILPLDKNTTNRYTAHWRQMTNKSIANDKKLFKATEKVIYTIFVSHLPKALRESSLKFKTNKKEE